MIENKSINNKSYVMGQYMTPNNLTENLLENFEYNDDCVYIEPSFGTCNFIKTLIKHQVPITSIIGCELDKLLYKSSDGIDFEKSNINFYDFNIETPKKIIFIGNPPFRTPALSLTTHPSYIKKLCKKYNVKGIREESVFFILKCLEIIETNGKGGEIQFILPQSIFTNNSKFFLQVQSLINSKFNIKSMIELPDGIFDGASLKMVFVKMEYVSNKNIQFVGNSEEYWDYTKIFKRTYLGSVPCESIFLSSKNEDLNSFRERLIRLYNGEIKQLDNNLRYQGKAHLKVLNSDNDELKIKKLNVIWDYITQIKNKYSEIFIEELEKNENYKIINHRNEIRYYFRCEKLKKFNFVYEINPNPQKSFYFTGNPSKSSTDYFGYCDYDITRNSSPGACRTIPIKDIESNITEDFKLWWESNNLGKFDNIFELFIKTSKSIWYKNMKKKYNRFYFGIPKDLTKLGY
jgi:hypothetical protein